MATYFQQNYYWLFSIISELLQLRGRALRVGQAKGRAPLGQARGPGGAATWSIIQKVQNWQEWGSKNCFLGNYPTLFLQLMENMQDRNIFVVISLTEKVGFGGRSILKCMDRLERECPVLNLNGFSSVQNTGHWVHKDTNI